MLVPFMLNGKLSQEFPLNTGNPQNHSLGSAPYDISIPFKNYNNLHYSCDFERQLKMVLESKLKNNKIKNMKVLRVIAERKKRKKFPHANTVVVHVGSDRVSNNVQLINKNISEKWSHI